MLFLVFHVLSFFNHFSFSLSFVFPATSSHHKNVNFIPLLIPLSTFSFYFPLLLHSISNAMLLANFLYLVTVAVTVAADSSSYTHFISNSFASDISLATVASHTSSSPSSSSTLDEATASSVVTENSDDISLFKFIFTKNSIYYDTPVTIHDQSMDLRLDMVQNNVWVINGDEIMDCEHINTWWSSEESKFGTDASSLPASVTTQPEYTVTMCADAGALTTDDLSSDALVAPADIYQDYEDINIPYVNAINASGDIIASNISLYTAHNDVINLTDFTFYDIDSSNVYVGGFGVAGNNFSDQGILGFLERNDIIYSNSYSLYFNTFSDTDVAFGQLLPGVVNSKYYVGDLYQFDMLEKSGSRYGPELPTLNQLMDNMIIPFIVLNDLTAQNQRNGDKLSLFNPGTSGIPIIFDSRTVFNMFPLDIIVLIAMQTNAFYSNEVNRWIVDCETIRGTDASLVFTFGELDITIPIDDVLMNATYYDKQLTFSSGRNGCYLNFLPTTNDYSVLGLSFLKSAYIAVDNEGGKIGLAQANSKVQVKQSDYSGVENSDGDRDDDEGVIDDFFASSDSISIDSIAYITPGTIPFATTADDKSSLTLTLSPTDGVPDTLTVPARFSGIIITSGEVIMTQSMNGPISNVLPVFATEGAQSSDGSTSSESNSGNSITLNHQGTSNKSIYMILLLALPLLLFVL